MPLKRQRQTKIFLPGPPAGEFGHRRGIPAPTFLCPCKEKSPPERWKRNTFRLAQPNENAGVSSDAAAETRQSPAGCAIQWKLLKARRRKGQLRQSSHSKTERLILLLPRVPLRYAHTRGGYRLLPKQRVAKRNARGQHAEAFRFSTPMTTQPPTLRRQVFNFCSMSSAAGRSPASLHHSV